MSGKNSLIVLLAAICLFLFGVAEREPIIALAAFFTGGVGTIGLVSAALSRRQLPGPDRLALEERLRDLEKRAQVTEDELAATNRLLSSLTAERDFDRQLLASRSAFPDRQDGPNRP